VDAKRPTGPRILTAYLYLNDIEAGGGTLFPKLKTADGKKGITVLPKKGRLLLWPSVRNSKPSKKDYRMDYEGMAVEKGEKYVANRWIHLKNFKNPLEKGCTSDER